MKNIITVKRINDNARRIYELPEDVTLQQGTLVQVETRFGDRLYGITTTASALMDDTAVTALRAVLGMDATGDFLPVKAVYGEPEELGMDADEDEQEPGDEPFDTAVQAIIDGEQE